MGDGDGRGSWRLKPRLEGLRPRGPPDTASGRLAVKTAPEGVPPRSPPAWTRIRIQVVGCGAAQSLVLISPSTASGSDRNSTRLNSSHPSISYAVFCLKKKKKKMKISI